MNRDKIVFLQRTMALIDAILTFDAFFAAFYIRNRFFADQYNLVKDFNRYFWVLIAIIPLWLIIFHSFKLYDIEVKENYIFTFFKAVLAIGAGMTVLAAIFFFGREQAMSRLFFIIFAIVDLLMVTVFRLILKIALYIYRSNKKSHSKILVIGTNSMASRFKEYIDNNPQLMIDIVGYLQAGNIVHSDKLEVIGRIEELSMVLKDNVVDEVIFALPRDYSGEVALYVNECKKMGVTVNMLADLFDFTVSNVKLNTIGSLPVITFHTVPFDAWQLFLKRLMDIVGSVIGLVITTFAFIIVAPAIKIESPGPIFFSQKRVGKNGRTFKCYKFRSMYMDAEERKKELMKYNQMNGAIFKIKDDPRITKIGKFIRATSIDELPQFWNVLKGDMSLVGTRPPTLDEVEHYEDYHWKRLRIKPGITGIWQTSGRNKVVDFDDIVRMDAEYIDHWSIGLDIKLIAKTVHSVLAREGAC